MRYIRSEVFLGFNKTVVENVQLGKTLDLELSYVCPPPQGLGLSVVGGSVWAGALGGFIP